MTCCRKLFTDEEKLWGDGREGGREEGERREGGREERREGGLKVPQHGSPTPPTLKP